MSPEVIATLLGLLDQVTISGADPDIAHKAELLVRARAELTALAAPSASSGEADATSK